MIDNEEEELSERNKFNENTELKRKVKQLESELATERTQRQECERKLETLKQQVTESIKVNNIGCQRTQ